MYLFFDLLIFIGIIATAAPAVILLYHRKNTIDSWEYWHKKWSLFFLITLLFVTGILIYGSFIEPKLLIVREQTIDLPNVEKPIKIALFADSQVGPYKQTKHVEKIVETILGLEPDLVFIAGDIVNNGLKKVDETIYLQPLEKLADKIPTYAINGNHEYGINCGSEKQGCKYYHANDSKNVQQTLEKMGIYYLVNELRLITKNEQSFYLFGGDSFWADQLNFTELTNRDKINIPTIALIHNPAAAWETSSHNIDLMLSGHTHGGQIRLPWLGPLAKVDPTFPKKLYQGLHKINGMQLYITSGTGETGTRARLFNPPEIVLLTIK